MKDVESQSVEWGTHWGGSFGLDGRPGTRRSCGALGPEAAGRRRDGARGVGDEAGPGACSGWGQSFSRIHQRPCSKRLLAKHF